MLEVEHLSVRYAALAAVDDCSFSVSEGQCLMIVGPNGAGKSTILNAVSQGVPYTGAVRFLGRDLKTTDAALRARSIGVLSQNHFVGYAFTVEEVVRLGRYAHRGGLFSSRKADDERVEDFDSAETCKLCRYKVSNPLTRFAG